MSKGKTTAKLMLPAMRGKTLHKYMAQKAAEGLTSLGFEVSVEYPICLAGGGKDYVDLIVSCCAFDLAIEIETTPRNVPSNAAKANELGLQLWVVTPNRTISSAIARKLKRSAFTDSSQIRILTLGQFLNLSLTQILASWKGE